MKFTIERFNFFFLFTLLLFNLTSSIYAATPAAKQILILSLEILNLYILLWTFASLNVMLTRDTVEI